MTLDMFTLANRKLTLLITAFSIASAWIWAPALFVSAQVAYRWGLEGLLWFIVPNFLTLVLFAFFATKLRQLNENGYTLSLYIKERVKDSRVFYFYVFELILLSICAIAVQLIAGAKLLNMFLPHIEQFKFMILLAIIPACYTMVFGIKVSVIVDTFQYLLMVICLAIIVGYFYNHSYLTNISFTGTEKTSSLAIMLSFGIPTAIGLLAGAFGSQDFYQRAYAVETRNVKSAYLLGAVFFILVPIMMSTLGFVGISESVSVSDTSMTNFHVLNTLTGNWFILPLTIVIICGLISTIDSSQASASSLFGYDVNKILQEQLKKHNFIKNELLLSRLGIIIVTVIAILIACTGVTILQLFLIYGSIRSSVFGVTLVSVLSKRYLNGRYIFYSLLFTIVCLLPLNMYGVINKVMELQTVMAIAIVSIPGLVAYFTSKQVE